MAILRHGSRTGFWDGVGTFNQSTLPGGGVGVTTGATSAPQELGRGADNFSVYVQVTSAPAFISTFLLQIAHSRGINADGTPADQNAASEIWHDAWYLGTAGAGNSTRIEITIPIGGGAIAMLVPDFTAGWARLKRTDANAAVTVIAGWEIQSDG